MVLCLVRFGGLDKEPLQFSTDLGNDDYGAEAVGVLAAYGFFLIVFVQTLGILNGDQMQTSVSLRSKVDAPGLVNFVPALLP